MRALRLNHPKQMHSSHLEEFPRCVLVLEVQSHDSAGPILVRIDRFVLRNRGTHKVHTTRPILRHHHRRHGTFGAATLTDVPCLELNSVVKIPERYRPIDRCREQLQTKFWLSAIDCPIDRIHSPARDSSVVQQQQSPCRRVHSRSLPLALFLRLQPVGSVQHGASESKSRFVYLDVAARGREEELGVGRRERYLHLTDGASNFTRHLLDFAPFTPRVTGEGPRDCVLVLCSALARQRRWGHGGPRTDSTGGSYWGVAMVSTTESKYFALWCSCWVSKGPGGQVILTQYYLKIALRTKPSLRGFVAQGSFAGMVPGLLSGPQPGSGSPTCLRETWRMNS